MTEYDDEQIVSRQEDNTEELIKHFNSRTREELKKMSIDPLEQSIKYSSLTSQSGINHIQEGELYLENVLMDDGYTDLIETWPELYTDLERWFVDQICDVYVTHLGVDPRESVMKASTESILETCYNIYDIVCAILENTHLFLIRRFIDIRIDRSKILSEFSKNIPKMVEDWIGFFTTSNIRTEDTSLDNPIYGHILEEDILLNAKAIFSSDNMMVNIIDSVFNLILKNIKRVDNPSEGDDIDTSDYDNFSIVFSQICAEYAAEFEKQFLMDTTPEEDV